MKKLKAKPKFNGKVEKFTKPKPFYMVFVEGSAYPPKVKHDDYDSAFSECMRLANQENKTAYVLKSETEISLIPNVIQH